MILIYLSVRMLKNIDNKYVFGYNRFPAQFIVANFDMRRKYTPGFPGVFFLYAGLSVPHTYIGFMKFLSGNQRPAPSLGATG